MQSITLKVRKQHTGVKYDSEVESDQALRRFNQHRTEGSTADMSQDFLQGTDIPQLPLNLVFTSAVTAGNTDRVTVKTNVTQNAITQICRERERERHSQGPEWGRLRKTGA